MVRRLYSPFCLHYTGLNCLDISVSNVRESNMFSITTDYNHIQCKFKNDENKLDILHFHKPFYHGLPSTKMRDLSV